MTTGQYTELPTPLEYDKVVIKKSMSQVLNYSIKIIMYQCVYFLTYNCKLNA